MSILQLLKGKIKNILQKYFDRDKKIKFPVYYINGSQTLPPPLDPREEEKVLSSLNDDENSKQILVERNLRLVVYIAK